MRFPTAANLARALPAIVLVTLLVAATGSTDSAQARALGDSPTAIAAAPALKKVARLRARTLRFAVRLRWRDRSRGETRYEVRIGRRTERLRRNARRYTVRSLRSGTSYRIRVRACRRNRCARWVRIRVRTRPSDAITTPPADLAPGDASQGEQPSPSPAPSSPPPSSPPPSSPAPPRAAEASHPRILIRAQDLPRLRSWAVPSNPVWVEVKERADDALAHLSDGLPGTGPGSVNSGCARCEEYAFMLAFASIVAPDDPATAASEPLVYARHSRALVMSVVNKLSECVDLHRPVQETGGPNPLCGNGFATGDRSRWHGYALPMAVDELYAAEERTGQEILTSADRRSIRKVFRFLIERTLHSTVDYRPHPIGVVNDPQLLAGGRYRWGANNYFAAHMRNVTFLSLALDPVDDPSSDGGERAVWEDPFVGFDIPYRYPTLRGYLENATGAWLYVADHMFRTDAAGGVFPEGLAYGSSTGSYLAQTLTALATAGEANPERWGSQVSLMEGPFWEDAYRAFLHAAPATSYQHPHHGEMRQPVIFGDMDNRYELRDWIQVFGTLGIHDRMKGNQTRLQGLRFIQRTFPPGGAARFPERAGGAPEDFPYHQALNSVLYFLLFDPQAPPPADPRPALAPEHFAPGVGWLAARTGWGTDDRIFSFKLTWQRIDHQHGDGLDFGLFRKGEWLTKQRTTYGGTDSSQHNTLALENDRPASTTSGRRYEHYIRGSQWIQGTGGTAGDPRILARSSSAAHVYVTGDATNVYNTNPSHGSDDIEHASRSIVWLKPDHTVVYDRARSSTAGRFKRFWLQLAGDASIAGNRMTMTTPAGQHLHDTVLAPADAELTLFSNEPNHPDSWWTGIQLEPITQRLRVEAPGDPQDARFLNVLQGADPGQPADAATAIRSDSGTTLEGAQVAGHVVLFRRDLDVPFAGASYRVPQERLEHLLTGLTPRADYSVQATDSGDGDLQVTVRPGGEFVADQGGALRVTVGAGGQISVAGS